MAKMIIGTITGNNALIPIEYVKSLTSIKGYNVFFESGCSIPNNRNAIFEKARVLGEDLLFIDSDMVFTQEDVKKMEENLKKYDIVGGVCVMGAPYYLPNIFDLNLKHTKPKGSEVFEIGACGTAFMGISADVINALIEPFYLLKGDNGYYGSDISFCIRAKNEGFRVWCDSNISVGHVRTETKFYQNSN